MNPYRHMGAHLEEHDACIGSHIFCRAWTGPINLDSGSGNPLRSTHGPALDALIQVFFRFFSSWRMTTMPQAFFSRVGPRSYDETRRTIRTCIGLRATALHTNDVLFLYLQGEILPSLETIHAYLHQVLRV